LSSPLDAHQVYTPRTASTSRPRWCAWSSNQAAPRFGKCTLSDYGDRRADEPVVNPNYPQVSNTGVANTPFAQMLGTVDAEERTVIYNYAANGIDLLSIQAKDGSDWRTLRSFSNYANRLRSVNMDGTLYEWEYDGLSRRVLEKRNGTMQKRFVWEGTSLVQERDAANRVVPRITGTGMRKAGARTCTRRTTWGACGRYWTRLAPLLRGTSTISGECGVSWAAAGRRRWATRGITRKLRRAWCWRPTEHATRKGAVAIEGSDRGSGRD